MRIEAYRQSDKRLLCTQHQHLSLLFLLARDHDMYDLRVVDIQSYSLQHVHNRRLERRYPLHFVVFVAPEHRRTYISVIVDASPSFYGIVDIISSEGLPLARIDIL